MKNKINYSIYFLTFIFLTVTHSVVKAQDEVEEENECVRTLNKVQKLYEEGLIEQIEQKLLPCLNGTELSKEEKLQGYKLLALSHTYDGKDKEAEDAMINFLKLEPEYQPQAGVDPKEFFELYNGYHTSPLYTIALLGGTNWTFPQSYKEFGAYNTESDKKTYKSNVGFQIGFRGTRYIYEGLNVHLDLTFTQNSFTYTHDILEGYTNVTPYDSLNYSPGLTKGVTIESIETQTALTIPLSFSYTFLRDKTIRPYALLGFETRFLLGASNSISKTYFDENIAAVEVSDVENFKEERNSMIFSGVFGAGAKYKIKGGDIFLEAKYNLGISDQVKKDVVDVNNDIRLWNFYQQDNDFTMNNLIVNVGYTHYFYKPRKMKQPKKVKPEKEAKQPKEKKSKESKEVTKDSSKQRPVIE